MSDKTVDRLRAVIQRKENQISKLSGTVAELSALVASLREELGDDAEQREVFRIQKVDYEIYGAANIAAFRDIERAFRQCRRELADAVAALAAQ